MGISLVPNLITQPELRQQLETKLEYIRAATEKPKNDKELIKDIKNIYSEHSFIESPKLEEALLETTDKFKGRDIREIFFRTTSPEMDHSLLTAVDAHRDQFRKSQDPFVVHPFQVGYILHCLGLNEKIVIGGILHDTAEDNPESMLFQLNRIYENYGPYVAMLVNAVSAKPIQDGVVKDIELYNGVKIFSEFVKNKDVFAVRGVDNVTNLLTVQYLDSKNGLPSIEVQKAYIKKTIRHDLSIVKELDGDYGLDLEFFPYIMDLIKPYLPLVINDLSPKEKLILGHGDNKI